MLSLKMVIHLPKQLGVTDPSNAYLHKLHHVHIELKLEYIKGDLNSQVRGGFFFVSRLLGVVYAAGSKKKKKQKKH